MSHVPSLSVISHAIPKQVTCFIMQLFVLRFCLYNKQLAEVKIFLRVSDFIKWLLSKHAYEKKKKKKKQPRIILDLEKLNNHTVMSAFQSL